MAESSIQALTFDVFGTVVDWRSSIIEEGGRLGKEKGFDVDWARFADAWRGKYRPNMDRVQRGELPWLNLDALHRRALDELLQEFAITSLTEPEKQDLTHAWHRLRPWPDAVEGLTRLRTRYTLAPLSNGNVALLTNMAKRAGLPWDCILSTELVKAYKPDPATYRMAGSLLDVPMPQVMMVAAHPPDLRAAHKYGMSTAYVPRPREWGVEQAPEAGAEAEFDIAATDFVDLAQKLGT